MKSKPRRWPGVRFGWPHWVDVGPDAYYREQLAVVMPDSNDLEGSQEDLLVYAIEDVLSIQVVVERVLQELVIEARGLGTSWTKIAKPFGVRPTAVHKRFASREAEVLERVTKAREALERRALGETVDGEKPIPGDRAKRVLDNLRFQDAMFED